MILAAKRRQASGLLPGRARLALDAEDALPDDAQVFLEIPAPREIPVLLASEGNPWLARALQSISGVKLRSVTLAEHAGLAAALEGGGEERPVAVFDRQAPPGLPSMPTMYIGCQPPLPEGVAPPTRAVAPVIIDWDRSHPVNRFLVYADIAIEESLTYQPAAELHSLVEADQGSVIAAVTYRREGRFPLPAVVVGFDILKSNWPLGHYSFPIFFANAVRWLGAGAEEATSVWRAGAPLVHALDGGRTTESPASPLFRTPAGELLPASRGKGGEVSLSLADQVGVYDLVIGSHLKRRFPVSLLSASESRLAPLEQLDFGDFKVPVQAKVEEAATGLWRWFALGALAILLVEWYVYNRRMYV
jgi:hypothetical protein